MSTSASIDFAACAREVFGAHPVTGHFAEDPASSRRRTQATVRRRRHTTGRRGTRSGRPSGSSSRPADTLPSGPDVHSQEVPASASTADHSPTDCRSRLSKAIDVSPRGIRSPTELARLHRYALHFGGSDERKPHQRERFRRPATRRRVHAVSVLLLESEDVAWFRDDLTGARLAASRLAERIGLDRRRSGEVTLAMSEAASNLTKHAVAGAILLRVVRTAQRAGIEFLALDDGPGIADVSTAMRDGYSTVGTMGVGLGVIARLADTFDLHSIPGRGTVMLARFWPRNTPLLPTDSSGTRTKSLVGGLTRTISGGQECGDGWATRWDNTAASTPRHTPADVHGPAPEPSGPGRTTGPRSAPVPGGLCWSCSATGWATAVWPQGQRRPPSAPSTRARPEHPKTS
ncbi:anti-sigma regulatory factor [Streptomyces sp. NPDC059215]|uniref:anti-sigma regulatory factor n=1 Tax=Streptomyces sp. NPDC059215 TaxID=3346772 RepID=UPI0036C41656